MAYFYKKIEEEEEIKRTARKKYQEYQISSLLLEERG